MSEQTSPAYVIGARLPKFSRKASHTLQRRRLARNHFVNTEG
jgi:hypothetical protein